jgi:hypothetical protein
MPTLQRGELLARREILEKQAQTRPQEANQRSEGQSNESKHSQELYQNSGGRAQRCY